MRNLLFFILLFCVAQTYGASAECAGNDAAGHACENIDLQSHLMIAELGGDKDIIEWVSDMWGWVDDRGTPDPSDDREYAIVGRFCGTSFVDITDPVNPVYVGNLPDHSEFVSGFNSCGELVHSRLEGIRQAKLHEADGSIWRDIKVYGHYALIVAETNIHVDDEPRAGMQIFDLHRLRHLNPKKFPVSFKANSYTHFPGFGNAHNVFVNQLTGMVYAAGSDQCDGGPLMVDISEPGKPVEAGCYAGSGYTHDIQCVIYTGPDDEHVGQEICLGSNGNVGGSNTLVILDVTDPGNVEQLANASYVNSAYSHQGWLSEDQRYFFHNDELDEYYGVFNVFGTPNPVSTTRLLVWDVSDLDNPVLAREYLGRTGSTDHNNYVQGHYLYQSNYTAGLNILDISDPLLPVQAGYFDNFIPYDVADIFRATPETTDDDVFLGTWSNYPWYPSGVVGVSDISGGLYVVKPDFTAITSANTNVSVRALKNKASPGDTTDFELIVANQGPDSTAGLTVLLRFTNATVGSVSAGPAAINCVIRNTVTVMCDGLELAASESQVIEVSALAGVEGELRAKAFVTAYDVDIDSMDNSDQDTVRVKSKSGRRNRNRR